MEKKVRNRVPRGTVAGVASVASFLMVHGKVASDVKILLTNAGVPAKLLGDGMLMGMQMVFDLKQRENDEKDATEQSEIGEAVQEDGAPDKAGKSGKPASGRN